ncbi:hypothetical protein HU200_032247 [Digitaria exilis]|uniref:NAC domain-containing protein n=1 Tax=Digitaria exilis TaxID=1010633 RepID=A0A835BXB3_9POAL|nr:hypothetical protein HU200_032247 [Digitaria exilis]
MDDMWTSPPLDILLEVFRHMGTTDVALAARHHRQRLVPPPRPDRFHPDLLLGFFHAPLDRKAGRVRLQHASEPPLPSEHAAVAMPRTAGGDVDDHLLALYNTPVSCRDGLLLLECSSEVDGDRLCLYNAMTGDKTLLPAAAFKPDSYVLVTGYAGPAQALGGSPRRERRSPGAQAYEISLKAWHCVDYARESRPCGYDVLSPSSDEARVVAVRSEYTAAGHTVAIRHQQLSLTSGCGWGPVKRSPESKSNLWTNVSPGTEVVCGGAIHWLGFWSLDFYKWFGEHLTADELQAYTLAVDVLTGRTWATKLPDQCRFGYSLGTLALATSADGRLSVVMDCRRFAGGGDDYIQVWTLVGEDRWALERTIAVEAHDRWMQHWKSEIVFCPRSGCVLVVQVNGDDIVIELDTGSSRRIPSGGRDGGLLTCGDKNQRITCDTKNNGSGGGRRSFIANQTTGRLYCGANYIKPRFPETSADPRSGFLILLEISVPRDLPSLVQAPLDPSMAQPPVGTTAPLLTLEDWMTPPLTTSGLPAGYVFRPKARCLLDSYLIPKALHGRVPAEVLQDGVAEGVDLYAVRPEALPFPARHRDSHNQVWAYFFATPATTSMSGSYGGVKEYAGDDGSVYASRRRFVFCDAGEGGVTATDWRMKEFRLNEAAPAFRGAAFHPGGTGLVVCRVDNEVIHSDEEPELEPEFHYYISDEEEDDGGGYGAIAVAAGGVVSAPAAAAA